MAGDDVNRCISEGNDVDLIPLVGFHISLELVGVAENRQEPRLLSLFGSHDLTAPGNDSARSALLVELAGVSAGKIEIGLISLQIPFGVCIRDRGRRDRTAILD